MDSEKLHTDHLPEVEFDQNGKAVTNIETDLSNPEIYEYEGMTWLDITPTNASYALLFERD